MAGENSQRIDKWLFFARVVKSRSLAAKLVEAGRVRRNGQKLEQPAESVRAGDTLTITIEQRILIYRVLLPGTRRGPASEAQTLHEDLSSESAADAPPDELPSFRGGKQ